MSHGIGGISVRVIGKPIEMTEEQKRALEDVTFERTGSLAEFYEQEREVKQINRDEAVLEDLYKRYGDRRICELLAIIRKRRDEVKQGATYQKYKEIERVTQRRAFFTNPICDMCPYDYCKGNNPNCPRIKNKDLQ